MLFGSHDFQLDDTQSCGDRIQHLRMRILVHSYLYYELDQNILSDREFDALAYELVELQTKHPEVSEAVWYERDAFRDFDGSTGFHLPYKQNEVIQQIAQILIDTVGNETPAEADDEHYYIPRLDELHKAEEKKERPMGGVQLYPHQQEAVEKLSNGKVLVGGVGTGKTITSLVYYYTKVMGGELNKPETIKTPKDIYVFTTARKRDELDWQRDAAKLIIGKDREASVHGIQLTVDSYNNIKKYATLKDAFIILDEQRMVGSGAWTRAFISMAKHNEWIMLSATPGDKWEDYIPLFIANGFVKNRTEFKRNHIVYASYSKFPKVERYLGVAQLVKWRNEILVQMPYARHTTRNLHDVTVPHDKEKMDLVMKKRWNPYENRPLQDVAEMFACMRRVAYSHQSRREAVIQLLKHNHPRLIVFYNFNYELEILRTIAKDMPGLEVAEWNGHKHEPVPTGEHWLYLVQYVAGAEAWNCVATDAICFYSQTYSYKNFEQAQGRIDRLNTPFTQLHYYILKSTSAIDLAVSRSLSAKRSFNESEMSKFW